MRFRSEYLPISTTAERMSEIKKRVKSSERPDLGLPSNSVLDEGPLISSDRLDHARRSAAKL